jgi:metallo-beta-lactamase family protein
MYLEFYGAAGGVTGSLHRLHVNGEDVLLDCGLFQGRRAEANRRNRQVPDWAIHSTSLVLSHAHIDHSGNIPSLVKRGFQGNIYSTPATRDLCSVMLRDAGMIQEQDARYINRRNKREGSDERVDPIYTVEDAEKAVTQMISVPLHRRMQVAPGVTATFHNAGHVLGSALVQLDLSERGRNLRVLFTGDLGRAELPLLRPPEIVEGVDLLITESTYGDRLHPAFERIDDDLAHIINQTIERKGRVYIPTFALERAQEVLFALDRLGDANRIPRVPIYIDSPLAISITEIYKLHPESLADNVRDRMLERNDPFSPSGLRYISAVEDSKDIQRRPEPCIIMAGSGMCEGGRIVHHLKDALGSPNNSIVIVGFMAQHTLGRRLVERRKKVNVFGVPREVHAQIHVLNGLSAHADQDDLVEFARATAAAGHIRRVALVHGEPDARDALAKRLRELGDFELIAAERGQRVEL